MNGKAAEQRWTAHGIAPHEVAGSMNWAVNKENLAKLAEAYGIAPAYISETGEHRVTSDAAKRGVLRALGVTTETELPTHATETIQSAPNADALRCFLPDWLQKGKAWGVTCQLYGLRSNRNGGIGDFEDLARLAEIMAEAGADFIGINPLHALFLAEPQRSSPYSPSSRRFLNPLYIALDRIGAPVLPDLKGTCASDLVDYETVGRLKRDALAARYQSLGAAALELPAAQSFKAFVAERGEALRLFALFEALSESMASESMVGEGRGAGWHGWPHALQNPNTPEVESFARAHGDQICFYMWLQWIADAQLADAQRRAERAGMRIGLYLDIAVGVAPDGAETWMDSASVVAGAHIGSPPDSFNEHGQDWGLAPLSPLALREHDCAGFVSVMEAAMGHAGAVRIDHVMGLMRLYWIPEGASADDGAYVHYPLADLMSHLAATSHRHHAVVIGEDLGTVPPGYRDILSQAEIQGCRVLYFEREGNAFRGLESYPRETLASISTHDLPTLRGWWEGEDIEARLSAGIYSSEAADGRRTVRAEEKQALLALLSREGVLPDDVIAEGSRALALNHPLPNEMCVGVHRFLARAPARLVAVQLEDLLGMSEQPNLPGTTNEYPNWRRRLACNLEELKSQPLFRKIVEAMVKERPRWA